MREYEAGIIRIEPRGPSAFVIDLDCVELAGAAVPGQFVQVRVSEGTDPFLRRTFSISGTDPDAGIVRLMIDVVGRGTRLLCGMRTGAVLDCIGPLGRGFDPLFGGPEPCLLVGGGVGVAPILFLADRFRGERKVTFLMGARTADYLAMADDPVLEGMAVRYATEDGSRGWRGYVTGPLEEELSGGKYAAVYACGPHPMLRAVAGIARKHGVPCQVSLEERMACGIGACLGCAVQLADGSVVRACKEGPVFDAEEIAW